MDFWVGFLKGPPEGLDSVGESEVEGSKKLAHADNNITVNNYQVWLINLGSTNLHQSLNY